ncbi:polysaccharide pyruvyl transferase family protein [Marinitenerispora sediminis]|uniref:Polysaccharide pyruvyl transferase n=1 Tax=Marinitenerispora sediminis TaxID=1931232 RepID=A0A368SZ98_9ACTN|nr:polysaccharide pyruvyl transferase family protein [Marinitenerispora sediminis]RCV48352.1 polysaccharide pyruvyl transferase [Marinitenerispora sediminis]RCV49888.1 polysaccharide pyruvyl transferase [Marinitenerispora sediminis]RCV50643.1 polysaccharide pyruvyl transferase [Marinitenerispora sediminis]
MRVLITGWFSFLHGEATAGDVGSAATVAAALRGAGLACDVAWSPAFRPDGLRLEDAAAEHYSHLLFVCGPAHGGQVRALHERYARCRRIAAGVSVVDPDDPAVRGFHRVIARDRPGAAAMPDLAHAAPRGGAVPVVGVTAAPEQPEYGVRSGHEAVHRRLAAWLTARDCARVPLDTRLDRHDWRHCATLPQFDALVRRVDLVVTTRLHGLVLALRNGVPALAVDPVAGGAKVRSQGRAWEWPVAVVPRAGEAPPRERLDELWRWCRSPAARERLDLLRRPLDGGGPVVAELLRDLRR